MTRFYLSAALLGILSLAGRAEAGSLYGFWFSGGGISGSGTFDTSIIGGGVFAISSTGTITGDPYIANLNTLVPNNNAPGRSVIPFGNTTAGYDDQLFPGSSPLLDVQGVMWSSDGNLANVYYWAGGGGEAAGYYFLQSANYSGGYGVPVTFVLTSSVPEPSTLVLGGAAVLIGLGIAWRRRHKGLAV
jgi:hypothetical protein